MSTERIAFRVAVELEGASEESLKEIKALLDGKMEIEDVDGWRQFDDALGDWLLGCLPEEITDLTVTIKPEPGRFKLPKIDLPDIDLPFDAPGEVPETIAPGESTLEDSPYSSMPQQSSAPMSYQSGAAGQTGGGKWTSSKKSFGPQNRRGRRPITRR